MRGDINVKGSSAEPIKLAGYAGILSGLNVGPGGNLEVRLDSIKMSGVPGKNGGIEFEVSHPEYSTIQRDNSTIITQKPASKSSVSLQAKFILEMTTRIKRAVEGSLMKKFATDWKNLTRKDKDTLLEKIIKDLDLILKGHEFIPILDELRSKHTDEKIKCAKQMAECIVQGCNELLRLTIESFDITDGFDLYYKQSESNSVPSIK